MPRWKVLVCVAAMLLWGTTASAQVRSYHLEVEGTSCLFRAFGLERLLRSIDAVRDVEVQPEEGRLELTMAPDTLLMPDVIHQRVRDAGLALRALHATIRGEIYRDLLIANRTAFTLLRGEESEHLAKLVASGARTVEVRGRIQRHGDDWSLVTSSVRRVEDE